MVNNILYIKIGCSVIFYLFNRMHLLYMCANVVCLRIRIHNMSHTYVNHVNVRKSKWLEDIDDIELRRNGMEKCSLIIILIKATQILGRIEAVLLSL